MPVPGEVISKTPAAAHVPSVVATVPTNVPTGTSGTPDTVGADIVAQSPAVGRSPR